MKLIIISSDQSLLQWENITKRIGVIQKTLNKTKNGNWIVEVKQSPLAPQVTLEGRIDQSWYDTISAPLFNQGYHEVFLHFSQKQWQAWALKNTLRGSNLNDTDFIGESYGWSDETTLRGKYPQWEQVILHELWHSLARACGVKDTLHDWHTTRYDITKADWSIFDMNQWQPKLIEQLTEKVSILQKTLALLKEKPVVNDIQPLLQRKITEVLKEMEKNGNQVKVVEGYRSIEKQNELYKQGRTTPGKIVTNAKGGESFHNYGVAVDFCFVKNGYNVSKEQWEILGAVGEKHGLEWGGRWTNFVDLPHFQLTLGYSLQDFYKGKVDYNKFK